MSTATSYREAVQFFVGDELSREMLYSEFEAILDGFIPLPDHAGQCVRAVYVRVNATLKPIAAVFFTIDFDEHGYADPRWNVPLVHFAEVSARGPDLGAGSIRLACASQCAVAWHQARLWEPKLKGAASHGDQMCRSLANNRLGFVFESAKAAPETTEADVVETLYEAVDELRSSHLPGMLQSYRSKGYEPDSIDQLQREHQSSLTDLRQQLQQMESSLLLTNQRLAELEQERQQHLEKVKGLQSYFEHKIDNIKTVESQNLQALQASYEQEKIRELERLNQMLCEAEAHGQQLEQDLHGLMDKLQMTEASKAELAQMAGVNYLRLLHKAGITFTTFQLGAGHMTLPAEDVETFLADPVAYSALRCGVSRPHLLEWLEHFHNPNCTHLTKSGSRCDKPLVRIDRPAQYISGCTDRCELHRDLIAEAKRRMVS